MVIESILFVDDEKIFREMIPPEISTRFGKDVKVDTAEDVESALKLMRNEKYDLILLDSLEMECFKIVDIVNNENIQHGTFVLFSNNIMAKREGMKRNLKFYFKGLEDLDQLYSDFSSN